MPFDEFSLIIEDYIELLKARKAQRDKDEAEARRRESDEKRMQYEMTQNNKLK